MQFALGRNPLRSGEGVCKFRETRVPRAVACAPHEVQIAQTIDSRHQASVRDGVRRPGQQVGQAERST